MDKIVGQISFIDSSSAALEVIDSWYYIPDISKFPIPHKDELVNLCLNDKCIDYVVTEVKYAYKHDITSDSSITVIYISIYVRRI